MGQDAIDRREAFRRWVKSKGGAPQIERDFGIAATTLYSYLGGKSESLTGTTLGKLRKAFGVTEEELFGQEATVPVVGYVQAGAEAVLFSDGQGPFDFVPAPKGSTEKTVAVQVRGESLGPFFSEWLVYYDDVRSPITQDLLNELCVVGLPDGRILVKKLQPSKSPNLYHLMSQTEGPILDQEVDWAAKVKTMSPR